MERGLVARGEVTQATLRDLLLETVDFEALRACTSPKLYLCATNVLTGKIRVFEAHEVTPEVVLASACLPLLFQAVEVNGEHYWDGGFMGNPPIFPLIYGTDCCDVLIVQINPIAIPEVPRTARAILDRMNTLSFNSSLMREMRAVHFVTRLIDEGLLPRDGYKRMNWTCPLGVEGLLTNPGAPLVSADDPLRCSCWVSDVVLQAQRWATRRTLTRAASAAGIWRRLG